MNDLTSSLTGMPLPGSQPDTDPLDDMLATRRDAAISRRIREADAEKEARVSQLSREYDMPAVVISADLPGFEAQARTGRAQSVMAQYPGIGAWSQKGNNAAIAADDYDNLGVLGKVFYGVKNAGATLEAGVYDLTSGIWGTLAGVAQNASDVSPLAAAQRYVFGGSLEGGIASFADTRAREGRAMAERANPSVESWTARNLLQGIRSLPTTAGSIAVGLTAGPTAGASVAGISVGGGEYLKARDKGLSAQRAGIYAAAQGAVETLTERLPVSNLIGDLVGKSPLAKTFLRQLYAEIPGEQAATVLQDLNEWATLNPDKSFQSYIDARPMAAAETFVATLGGVGATSSISVATERTARVVGKVMDRSAKAREARDNGAFLDGVAEAVGKSKLATRDPDAAADLLQHLGDETGADRIFIPAEALRAYEQSDGYSGEFDSYRDAIDEAYATGGDWVVPIGEAAKIANTPAWAALRNDMRLSPGGMSVNEAQDFEGAMADVMDGLSETAAQEAEAARAEQAPRDTLQQSIADKLMNAGFTPSTATQQAELLTQRATTRATRMGQTITGDEFADVQVNQVLPPALAEIQKADQTDILIDVMKRNVDPANASGPSLMDFVSKAGGIVDTGGDLKAMGADKWHVGKPGKRRLVRDAPGELLEDGGLGVNEYAADQMARRAFEAGYFPELTEAPDANTLLDAISEGVAGRDRYSRARDKTMRDAAQELRAMLDSSGVDPDTASRKEIRDALAAYQTEQERGASFDQTLNDGPRGRITFPAAGFGTGPSVIELFQARDQSTFLHETGHLWLEELRFDATEPDAPDQLKADWQAVQDWFTANGHPVADGVIPVDAHEIWARGVERYLMEGNAPTPTLRRAFEAFKSWLVSVYRSVDRLKSPVTPEIRAVMDRLIATDEEIASAAAAQNIEALFPDKPDQMTGDEFAAYQASTVEARGAAHDALLAKVMGAVKRRVTKEYKDRRATVEADVTATVDARPEFRALRQMKETPIDSQWVRDTFGEDATVMLPKQVPPIYKDGGVDADEVAERSGFTSGDEMVRTLMGVETARRQLREGGDLRSVRKALIDQEVDALMLERYGDPFTDGSIEEEALAIIHNDQQGEVVASELRVLARSTGQRVTPYRIAKDWAARTIRDGKVKDVASRSAISRYQRAASKSAKAAMDAVIAGDTAEAFRQKQAQMLNNALISEAKRAADEIEAAVKRLEKVAAKRTMASIDQDYLERAQGLLEQVDMKARTQRFLDRQESYEAWAREQEEGGRDMATPPSFAATLGTTHWSRLTVDQLLGLDATVKQIMHLGRHKQKLLDAKEERDFEEVVADAIGGMDGIPTKPSDVSFEEPGWFDRSKSLILGMDANMLKMETVFDWLDQGKNGVFNRVVFQRFVDAQENRRRRIAGMMKQLEEARQKIPEKVRKRWGSKVTLDMIDPETGRAAVMTRDKLIAMALNMGNEGNARKLAGGYGWNEQSIMDTLNQHLTAEEWQFVQDSWDIIDTLWPDIAALERRLNGVEPDKVEAREVQTSAGVLRGGYYPVVYDPTRSLETEQQGAISADKLFESGYRRANTRAGSTNERTTVERPVFLSLSVISRHIGEVVHDVTHREAVIDAHRFLNDKRIIKEVRSRLGEHVQKQFNPWLQHIANEWASDAQGTAALEKMVKSLRTNATFVGMGFRFSTTIMQFAGLFNSAERVGSRWVAEGVYRLAKNPVETMRFVLENSQEVAARVETMDRDIRDTIKREQSKIGRLSEAKQFAFYFIGMADRFVSTTTWIGAYNRALTEGQSDSDAIAYADKAVRQSQGAGAAKDLAAIQRGKGTAGEAGKLLTMFYSYMSAFYQRQRTLGRDYGKAVRTGAVKDFPSLLARTMLLYFFPALASELLAGRGPDEDDDETWASWAAWKIGLSALGPIPVVRDVIGGFASGFGYNFTPASGLGRSTVNTLKNAQRLIEGEETKRATRDALETAGYFGAPVPGQVAAAAQFMVDVSAGEQDPEGFGDWWDGLTTGKIKED